MNQRNPEPSDQRPKSEPAGHPVGPGDRPGPRSPNALTRWAVDIRREAETAQGWSWEVWLHPADNGDPESRLPEPRSLQVSMSWVDHDHLCHGRMSPSDVVSRILRHLLSLLSASTLPAKLDVSRVSRLISTQGGTVIPKPAQSPDDGFGAPDPSDLSRLFDTVG